VANKEHNTRASIRTRSRLIPSRRPEKEAVVPLRARPRTNATHAPHGGRLRWRQYVRQPNSQPRPTPTNSREPFFALRRGRHYCCVRARLDELNDQIQIRLPKASRVPAAVRIDPCSPMRSWLPRIHQCMSSWILKKSCRVSVHFSDLQLNTYVVQGRCMMVLQSNSAKRNGAIHR